MVRALLTPPVLAGRPAVGVLLLRLIVGIAFMLHGWQKIQNPTGWMTAMMGPHAFAPPFLQACAAVVEFFGGLALILGIVTPVVAVLIIIDMLVAIFKVHLPMGGHFVGGPGSFEQPLTYLVAMLLFLLAGPGIYSLDARLFAYRSRSYRRG